MKLNVSSMRQRLKKLEQYILYPHELSGWRAERGQADVTAQPVAGTTWDDLDPLEWPACVE